MGNPNQEQPLALPLVGILARPNAPIERSLEELAARWGPLKRADSRFLFDQTDYYRDEMGEPLYRRWVRLETLEDPANLKQWKQVTNSVEDEFRDPKGNRRVNLDPGYLMYELFVLGSNKHDGQKIHLGDGVFADPQLQYGEGRFQPFPWSFPDFQTNQYYDCFESFREYYCTQRSQH